VDPVRVEGRNWLEAGPSRPIDGTLPVGGIRPVENQQVSGVGARPTT